MSQLTWEEVLARKDLVGGDIEYIEDSVVYRGPLAEIKRDGEMICFSLAWCGRLDPETDEWEIWHITAMSVNVGAPVRDIGKGRVSFLVPFLGRCTIFPKGGSKLDPNKVKGLPKASERFLKLFPDLVFDRAVVERVLINQFFERTLQEFSKLSADAKLADVLACFRHDSQAEEFAWHYVEAMTGQKSVHQRIY